MKTLSPDLRKQLERTVILARDVAESGARAALEALAVHHHEPYGHMDSEPRKLRRRLRAHARQLGDRLDARSGSQGIDRLVHECAYEHWHGMLFARFLAENHLLIEPDMGVAITLDECEELAKEEGVDEWALAARFAHRMLPQVFRPDHPVFEVRFAREHRLKLEGLVERLPGDVFTATDSLGWVYQFWQTNKKNEINRSGVKIGADELPSVTQLFTEDYMVDFLLDNTLGAWRGGKVLAANPRLAENAQSEEELRKAVALPGCPWRYLRFIQKEGTSPQPSPQSGEGEKKWTPAAGTFDGWPKTAQELKCLDPCMGSGHFVVAMFERLVALRMAEEKLIEAAAVAAVIRENLFGLEIDPRCTQIGAFNLALAAWRRVGYRPLPAMNLACSGLAPNAKQEDWLAIAGDNQKLQRGMERLYGLFQKAAVLGSLINPRAGEGDLLEAAFHELQPLLEKALAQETRDDTAHEMAVTARGLAKAAEILAGQFTLVATNVPYLGRGKQNDVLKDFCDSFHPDSKAGLATTFTERCLGFAQQGCTTVLVTPENWLSLSSYKKLREKLIRTGEWNFLVRLGPGAFQTPMWDFNTILLSLTKRAANRESSFLGVDGSEGQDTEEKAVLLNQNNALAVPQMAQLTNPDVRIGLSIQGSECLLSNWASSFAGLGTGDFSHYGRCFWEFGKQLDGWAFYQTTVESPLEWSGREQMVAWDFSIERVRGMLPQEREQIHNQDQSGQQAWGKRGIAVGLMGELKPTIFTGERYDKALAAVIPDKPDMLPALWAFCSDPAFNKAVRQLDQNLFVGNGILVKVSFDLAHWQKVAAEKYPHGLPKPFSSESTQWLFNGNPAGADQPLHVAVARLLGYQWPRQTGSSFPDCPALGSDGLLQLADADGIVCLPSVRGEPASHERLLHLLEAAWGDGWSNDRLSKLLADAGASSLDEWLRNQFFDQHCKLFHHRPFIWHIWDGRKRDGFHALISYHRLAEGNGKGRRLLETLTYSYLGDWIARQRDGVKRGEGGSEDRLAAALELQKRLVAILEGEPPFDIFVRWKPIEQQAIGWETDINDGVRLNIRPFMAQDIPGGKKGTGILRIKPNIHWKKDRGKEPMREQAQFPWFWNNGKLTGERVNDVHLTITEKRAGRVQAESKQR